MKFPHKPFVTFSIMGGCCLAKCWMKRVTEEMSRMWPQSNKRRQPSFAQVSRSSEGFRRLNLIVQAKMYQITVKGGSNFLFTWNPTQSRLLDIWKVF